MAQAFSYVFIQENWKQCPLKDVYVNAQSSLFVIATNWEQNKCSVTDSG